jgi:hypothetical protein
MGLTEIGNTLLVLRKLAEGKELKVGDYTLIMASNYGVGFKMTNTVSGEITVACDLTVSQIHAMLVHHDIVVIP